MRGEGEVFLLPTGERNRWFTLLMSRELCPPSAENGGGLCTYGSMLMCVHATVCGPVLKADHGSGA